MSVNVDHMPSSVMCASQSCVYLWVLWLCPEGCLCITWVIFPDVCVPLYCVDSDDGRGLCVCLSLKVLCAARPEG